MNYLKSLKWEMVLFSALCIGLGCIMFFNPKESQTIIGAMLAAIIFVYAFRHFVEFFRRRNVEDIFRYELVMGIIFAVLGIVVLTRMDIIFSLITYLIAVIVLISGLMKVENAFDLKRMGRHWVPMLVVAALFVIVGILLMMAPLNHGDDNSKTAGDFMVQASGVIIAFTGLINLITTFSVSGQIKKWNKEQNMTVISSDEVVDVEYEEVDSNDNK